MQPFKSIPIGTASIRLAGIQRCGDDFGYHAFEVEIKGRPPLYGEWMPEFLSDGNGFNVIIVGFGFSDKRNLDNIRPGARVELSEKERDLTIRLVTALFADHEALTVVPFTIRDAGFLGGVSFKDGWITVKPSSLWKRLLPL